MKSVLYIGHGSRLGAGNEQLRKFVSHLSNRVEIAIQELAFIDHEAPSISEGIKTCIARGATEIFVQPILLLEAAHAKEDIPAEMAKMQKLYPHVLMAYGTPIGANEQMIPIVVDRLQDGGYQRHVAPIDAKILFVGRGSSDALAIRDFEKLAQFLKDQLQTENVSTSYLAAATPSFEEELVSSLAEQRREIYVVPYLLFTGILMKKMQKTIDQYNLKQCPITLCQTVGDHEQIFTIFQSKINHWIDRYKMVGAGNEFITD